MHEIQEFAQHISSSRRVFEISIEKNNFTYHKLYTKKRTGTGMFFVDGGWEKTHQKRNINWFRLKIGNFKIMQFWQTKQPIPITLIPLELLGFRCDLQNRLYHNLMTLHKQLSDKDLVGTVMQSKFWTSRKNFQKNALLLGIILFQVFEAIRKLRIKKFSFEIGISKEVSINTPFCICGIPEF